MFLGKRGSILLFSLQLYLFFLAWIGLRVVYIKEFVESRNFISIINKNLELEKKALEILKETRPNCPSSTLIDDIVVEFRCNSKQIEVIFNTSMPYRIFYDIIDANIKAKG